MEERMNAIRAVAGKTEVGKLEDPEITKNLRKEGIVNFRKTSVSTRLKQPEICWLLRT